MSDEEEDHVEIQMSATKNGRNITLKFKSTRKMSMYDFLLALEDYTQELWKSFKDMPESDSEKH